MPEVHKKCAYKVKISPFICHLLVAAADSAGDVFPPSLLFLNSPLSPQKIPPLAFKDIEEKTEMPKKANF